MKTFLKYLGAIVVLLGAGVLAVYYFMPAYQSNGLLLLAMTLMVAGLVYFIIENRFGK